MQIQINKNGFVGGIANEDGLLIKIPDCEASIFISDSEIKKSKKSLREHVFDTYRNIK